MSHHDNKLRRYRGILGLLERIDFCIPRVLLSDKHCKRLKNILVLREEFSVSQQRACIHQETQTQKLAMMPIFQMGALADLRKLLSTFQNVG